MMVGEASSHIVVLPSFLDFEIVAVPMRIAEIAMKKRKLHSQGNNCALLESLVEMVCKCLWEQEEEEEQREPVADIWNFAFAAQYYRYSQILL